VTCWFLNVQLAKKDRDAAARSPKAGKDVRRELQSPTPNSTARLDTRTAKAR